MSQEIREKIMELILHSDRNQAVELLADYARQNDYLIIQRDILEPVLLDLGERWQKDLSLAHGYIAGKIAEDFLNQAAMSEEYLSSSEIKGSVVIGNIEDDYHALGRKMLATFLKAKGWEVYDLGNDVLAEDFVDKAIETKSKIIGASAMMYSTAITDPAGQ
jgi:methanogenic corrinoid protein MtbC1